MLLLYWRWIWVLYMFFFCSLIDLQFCRLQSTMQTDRIIFISKQLRWSILSQFNKFSEVCVEKRLSDYACDFFIEPVVKVLLFKDTEVVTIWSNQISFSLSLERYLAVWYITICFSDFLRCVNFSHSLWC